jgi:alkylhydroperoxidase family enzyme
MARIPYPDLEAAHQTVRETYAGLPVKINLFRMLAHAERSYRAILQLGGTILGRQQLSSKLREHTILLVAQLSRARYEWVQHVPIALRCDITQQQIDAIEREEIDAACFDAQERAVLAFAREVILEVRPSDEALAAVSTFLSHREVVELTITIGYYMMMARLMETTGVDVDEPQGHRVIADLGKLDLGDA